MKEDELIQLGEKRRLIFSNVANGVPIEDIKAAFLVSDLEIEQVVAFVGKKIKEYRFRRCGDAAKGAAPPILCETIQDARLYRLAAMETLSKLGPKYLASELLLPTIHIQKAEMRNLPEIRHRLRG